MVSEISTIGSNIASGQNATNQQQAVDAFGLGFEDLLQIVLTQLTYQDPLKPVENFEFVSQLAQFSQIQQTQTMSENLNSILATDAATQAASLLGRTVDIPEAGGTVRTGTVTSVSFSSGTPRLIVDAPDGSNLGSFPLSSISRVTEGE